MTIYNQVNNISDDYTFVLNTDELFYTKEEMPCGVFEYDTSNQTWTETRKTSNAFDTKYEDAKNFVKTYYQSILDIINPETKYSDLLTEVGAGNGLFIGIQMDSIEGFPQLNDNQYFITIISSSLKMCIPVKSFVLYSNTRIVENNDEELNDLEYLSAKQCLNLIYNAISKVEILQIVDALPTQPSDIKTNCVYLLYEENNQSQDEIDDGLNFHFTLWVYSTTDEEFKQIDRLTFDIKNYALKNHTHGQINNNGTIGNTAGIPLITGANGIVTVGTFGSSSSTTATDFVSCADTRLSDSRTPKTHASTATAYGVGTETKYGHNKVINNLTTSSYQNGESLSAYQGKILQDNINDVISSIPVKTSDLTNDGDGTNAFLTQHQSLSNYIQKSNTTGLLKNDGSVMTGGTGSSNYAIGNHTHEYPTYEYVSSVLKIAYSVNGTATNFDVSSVWSGNMTVDTPLFVFAKNTIGDNVANATLKFKSNGSDITILNVKNYMMQPIEAGVWKKDTWALFFCHGSSTVQLQGIFYDTTVIDTLINNVSEQIENANSQTKVFIGTDATRSGTSEYNQGAYGQIWQIRCNELTDADAQNGFLIMFYKPYATTYSEYPVFFDFVSTNLSNSVFGVYNLTYKEYDYDATTIFAYVKPERVTVGGNTSVSYYVAILNGITSSKEDKSNKVTSLSSSSTDTQYPSAKCVYDAIANANSNIVIDNTILQNSTNAVENGAIYNALANKEDKANKTSSWNNSTNNTRYPTEKLVKDSLDAKLDKTQTDEGFVKSNGNTVGFGTGSSQVAQGNHTHSGMLTTSDIINDLTTGGTNKVLSAEQGKELKELIGNAIAYINR